LEPSPPDSRGINPPSAGNTRAGFFQIHLAVFLFGFSGLLGKLIAAGPPVIVFGRTFFAAIALLAYLILIRRRPSLRPGRSGLTLFLSGVLLAAHWAAFFQSIQTASVSIALITFGTFPLWIAFLEPLVFREKLGVFDGIAALAVAAGLACVVPGFNPADRMTQGVLWGLLSGISFAVLSVWNRIHVRTHPPLTFAFYQLAFAAAASLPFAVGKGASLSAADVPLLLILGIVCTAAAQTLYIGSLRWISARTAGLVIGLEPVYGILLALILLGEIPSLRVAFGGLIILAAVLVMMIRKGRAVVPASGPGVDTPDAPQGMTG
jgi:drug/metabolite transporter (DMT)-like permease